MATNAAPADETDFTKYRNKAGTDLHKRFAHWISDKTGFDPTSDVKNKQEAFEEGVRLATTLRMPFQRSPENQGAIADRLSAKKTAADVKPKTAAAEKKSTPAKKTSPAKKTTTPAKREPKAPEPERNPLETGKPGKRTASAGRPPRKSSAGKPAPF